MTPKDLARDMRKAPTRSEDRVWSWLRDRRFRGVKFRRQQPFGRYMLDFYCPALKLAVEVDGTHHEKAWVKEYDDQRTLDLQRLGIEVIRIPNQLLIHDYQTAISIIEFAIKRREK